VNPDGAVVLVLTTEADRERAEALAQRLLEQGLVACVSLHSVTSLYLWQGRLERSPEVQLLIKTDATRLEELGRVVHKLHSYATPEWIHWPVTAGEAYGAWVAACTGMAMAAEVSSDAAPPDR